MIQTEEDCDGEVGKVGVAPETVVNMEVRWAVLGESIMKKAKFCIYPNANYKILRDSFTENFDWIIVSNKKRQAKARVRGCERWP